jgi:Arc/MetJ-type ribon-helix-helix transcriptional regulator
MNVSLPEPLQQFVQKKITDGAFRTADDRKATALNSWRL